MLRKREEARARLMVLVDQGRREQLHAQRRLREQELREEEAWAAKFIEDAKRGVREEQEDVERRRQRSEEHTSELQSLMRISYAVFCLKKKKKKNRNKVTEQKKTNKRLAHRTNSHK